MAVDHQNIIAQSLHEGVQLRERMAEQSTRIEAAGWMWIEALQSGGKILFCGNGGSAADSQHLAAELVGRFERENGFPALALTVDTSCMTAVGNDFGFDRIFSQQVLALGRPGDLLVGISTSGNSPNIVAALEVARQRGLATLALTGQSGGRAEEVADLCLKVPSQRTCRIQEIHLTLGHIWCEMVERAIPSPHSAREGSACG